MGKVIPISIHPAFRTPAQRREEERLAGVDLAIPSPLPEFDLSAAIPDDDFVLEDLLALETLAFSLEEQLPPSPSPEDLGNNPT